MRETGRAKHWDRLEALARAEVRAVLGEFDPELRTSAGAVTVRYETVPEEAPAAAGLGDDLLGLFIGPDFEAEDGHGSLPPQIFLFLESIWDYCDGDETAYREEVRTTFLHELGHYLGLDEEDVEERGL
jgi:predicted Zn-dependent protease with MMP-like domain